MAIDTHTKILATLGPSSNSEEKISELIDAGVDGFRLNFSHGTHEEHKKMYEDTYTKLEPHHNYVKEKIKNTDLAKMGELLKDLREILEDTIDIDI